ncbi:MAG: outer membrane protein assembly factor BamD [Paludibacteraceae bacterium]|nr:outer membrane protein assembly factor BamD [Paludibacteraceae bacterium]
MRKRNILYILLFLTVFSSCSSYEKLLKSNDNQLKFEEAKKYYAKKEYLKTITLLDAVSTYYKGTDKSEDVLFLTAQSYWGNKDYFSAANYYATYTKSFPRGKYSEECWFMVGYSHYKDSPDARLDQEETVNAINAFQEFLQIFPNSNKANDANKYVEEMQEKMAYKAYLNAKLYYDLGNYQGNNYLSAIITSTNALKDYPNTKYKEDFSFLVLESKFNQAEQSIPTKKESRFRETIDEYYNFVNDFPKSKYAKEAESIFKTSKNFVKE